MRTRIWAGFATFLIVLGSVSVAIGLEIFARKPCSDGGDCSPSYVWQFLGGVLLAIGFALIVGMVGPRFYSDWRPPEVRGTGSSLQKKT